MRLAPHSAVGLAMLVAAAAAPVSNAAPDHRAPACGDTITGDTRLTADLVGCPQTGLVIGADGVTLDLNGHRVEGDASGDDVGLDLEGHAAVTIVNGTVRGFADGVLVLGSRQVTLRRLTSADEGHGGITVESSRDVVITDNVTRGDGAGIIVARSDAVRVETNRVSGSGSGGIPVFGSRRVVVAGNTVTASSDAGVGLFDGTSGSAVTGNRLSGNGAGLSVDNGAAGNLITGNSVARNASGVILDVGTYDNQVVGNAIADSAFEGIAVVGSDGNSIARNRVERNGALDASGGIVVIPSPDDPSQTSDANVLADNAAVANGGDGIRVGEGQSANLLRGNRADRNTLLGIDAAPGTIDGGGNTAARNGDPRECAVIACGP
jgi:parallel beta-helix repeat protein